MPLAKRWHRLRAAYRFFNVASHHVLGFTVKLAVLAYFVFAVVFLFLRYAILPNIDYYKPGIERAASRALGNQVAIDRIYASWHGLRPNLFLGDVSLRDGDGRQVLSLPSVSATLSWWSVLAGGVRFESLEIIRPELQVRRAPGGKLYVAGIALADGGADGKGADWVLSQREIVIRDGRLHWTDGVRGTETLALDHVNLVLRNQWRDHQFGLQATPPASLAAPLDVRARFVHPPFARSMADVTLWKGEVYADLKGADLAAWKRYIDYPFELSQGKGALRAWLTLDHAKLAAFTADVRLEDVQARLGKDLPPLDLLRVRGRVSAREDYAAQAQDGKPTFGARGHAVSLSEFSLETRDGLSLPPTTLSERYVAAAAGKPQRTELRARALDLQTLTALAARLPLGAANLQLLEELAPRGRLEDFSAEWQGPLAAPLAFHVKGQVLGLGLRAQPARAAQPKSAAAPAQEATAAIPGFDNLTGSVDATDKGGSVNLASRDLVLQMPAYFAEPALPFEQLNLKARWSFEGQEQLRVDVDSFDFLQQGLAGTLKGSHLLPLKGGAVKGAGSADFSGTLNNFDLKTIGRYLPLQTPADLRHWLVGALEDGLAQDVGLRLRGELAHFPFKADNAQERARGEFRAAGRLENAKLNYAPGELAKDGKGPLWPQAERIKGNFVFDRARMEIRGDTAATGGVALANVKAVIADLTVHDMMLDIDGSAQGAMQEFLKYMAASPVLEWIAHFTDQTTASGNARLALKLHLPLNHMIDSKVQGTLQLAGNDIVLFDDFPPVQGTQGKIEFNEHGVNLNGLAGTFVGGPVAIAGGSLRDNSIAVRIGGAVSVDGLRKVYTAPVMQRLAGHLSGGARYSGLITARDHQYQVAVDSTLVGLGLDFPAPVKKAAADAVPFKFLLNGGAANEAGLTRDDIRINLGPAIAARYQRQKQGKEAWRVVRGGVGVNAPAPEPDSGMMVNVNLKSLNVDAWLALGDGIAGPAAGGAEAGGPELAQYVVPDLMAARAGELILGERKLENVVVGASHHRGLWQANVDSAQASGYVGWVETASGLGKMTARLSSLVIPESAAGDVKDLLEGKNGVAQTIPALDIVAERFELFNKQIGRLELQAYNAAATGRDWRVSKLSLANPDGELKGTGKWIVKDGQSNTSLNFGLDIVDAGKLLERFGFADTVRKGKGKLSGDISWKGLPYSLDIPSLSGQIQLNVESGQFLKQDPGAAKLLGVLSLQALPRLLKLDFHDVFSEGLAFDGITATAAITRGVAKTDNLKMHGVAATVLMDGSADIANESTNLHVVVIPEFNLGTGPLVYALAVNPVIGLGSFLAQLFLRAPVMKALTYQMQVAGPWKAPVITKLDSGKLEPVPVPAE
ncbi:YhdP family protein [Janthinobacterium sp. hw3]|uniref:YhdP family protein n=2 Tax=Janthinobacterium fluminis TaxID=2987524 RepID=A0ABT5JX10_9BURK|nr:YhdP family protein [Janthinobacterium fluminis]